MAITDRVMARPGNMAKYGFVIKYALAAFNMDPHSGSGGCAPSPKKLNVAAVMIAVPIRNVDWIKIGPIELGKICLIAIRISLAPAARIASTNGASRKDRN